MDPTSPVGHIRRWMTSNDMEYLHQIGFLQTVKELYRRQLCIRWLLPSVLRL